MAAASGARLCFGDPVESGGRTVIPVARVRGGGGGGRDGGGGGGVVASPVGFIEVSADGARFVSIPDPRGAALAALGATAVAGAVVAAARRVGARRLLTRRRAALPRSLRRSLPR